MGWHEKFKFKDLLSGEEVEPIGAQAIAIELVIRLRGSFAFPPSTRDALIDGFEGVEDQEGFNEKLSDLYDAADEHRVWCE